MALSHLAPPTWSVLQPLSGAEALDAGLPYLPATPATTSWGRLPSDADAPVMSVEPGTTVVVDTVSHEGILEDQGGDPVAFFGRHGIAAHDVLSDAITIASSGTHDLTGGPHVVTGPIEVRGAQPGDLIAVHMGPLTPRTHYGIVSSRHHRGLLPGTFPAEGPVTSVFCLLDEPGTDQVRATLPLRPGDAERPIRFPLQPFLGTVGVATPGERRHSVPPGPHGGNLDIRLLVTGTTLYLPVQVPGAGVYVGDPHFAQGNGEIALTALEAPLRATLTLDLIPADQARARFGSVAGPFAVTPEFLVPTGLDEDLDVAVARCGENAVALLGAAFGVHPEIAYAYLSAATDFEISQVVDLVKGSHAMIRLSDFAALGRELAR
ncbi:acetamidase/formamidase family protein [Kineosporia sp. J2-2]|uniref:Acetamidase/formamidase family protein n=1 Tax=Kineosporia corallincola TaxID=2835133 RepID=A0ABS5TSE8_9ACTN|nr:acetamidase/formamidase family protein [Kineosporia corallincola]MBT0773708.1 acetamidase/formamidase family protein [Kineosporia corallincola]